jgi:hypothetical protein
MRPSCSQGRGNRLLLRERLVRMRLAVEAHELGDEASEVVLAEEQDVVERSAKERATITRRARTGTKPSS